MNILTTTNLNRINTDSIKEILKCKDTVIDVVYHKKGTVVGNISQTLPSELEDFECEEIVFGTWKNESKITMTKPVMVVFGKSLEREDEFKFYYY